MKTPSRCLWTVALIGGALAFSGCTSAHTPRVRPVGFRAVSPAPSLTVVESSSNRKLTSQDLDALRDAVMKYLASEGLARSGEYFVRVDFPPEHPGDAAEWVVVKLTTAPAYNYTLVAAYPAIGPDDYYPYGFAYNQGYGGYGYWDPSYDYFNPGYAYPANYHPLPYPGDLRRRGDDKDNRPRGPSDRGDGRHDRNDNWRDRSDNSGGTHQRPDGSTYQPRTDGSGGSRHHYIPDGGGTRDHGRGDYAPPPRGESSGGSYSPPPPAPSSPPPPSDPAPARIERNDAETARSLNQDK
jgi:hypothetical protein